VDVNAHVRHRGDGLTLVPNRRRPGKRLLDDRDERAIRANIGWKVSAVCPGPQQDRQGEHRAREHVVLLSHGGSIPAMRTE
jgi:hypothetical protein